MSLWGSPTGYDTRGSRPWGLGHCAPRNTAHPFPEGHFNMLPFVLVFFKSIQKAPSFIFPTEGSLSNCIPHSSVGHTMCAEYLPVLTDETKKIKTASKVSMCTVIEGVQRSALVWACVLRGPPRPRTCQVVEPPSPRNSLSPPFQLGPSEVKTLSSTSYQMTAPEQSPCQANFVQGSIPRASTQKLIAHLLEVRSQAYDGRGGTIKE